MGASHTDADPSAWLGQSSSPDVDAWVRRHVEPAGALELEADRPWSTVLRVPLPDGGAAWFKHCKPIQAFEPRLTAALAARWPDRVTEVIACDEERAWLLLVDAGTPFGAFGNAPEAWEAVLPRYAELQVGEVAHADEHVAGGVPDMRADALPARYADMLSRPDLPITGDEMRRLAAFEGRFATLCAELVNDGIGPSIQHDDLHIANVYAKGESLRVVDWGDSSVAHPFFSLFETFRFLEHVNRIPRDDPWYGRLRDAYLEPWGDTADAFPLALRLSSFARVFAWIRQRDSLSAEELPQFDTWFPHVLRYAVEAAA